MLHGIFADLISQALEVVLFSRTARQGQKVVQMTLFVASLTKISEKWPSADRAIEDCEGTPESRGRPEGRDA
jgi:hypothetical protein